jgi:hypothetical protein
MKTRTFIAAGRAVPRTIATTRHLIFRRAWLWTGFLAFAAIAFGPQPAHAAVTEAWAQRYGSSTAFEDYASKVVTDPAGNVIVAGTTGSEMLVIKYSGAGVSLWTNRYNGSASAVAVDGRGNVFLTGNSDGAGGNSDYSTIAYSGAGVPLWTNRYTGSANWRDEAKAVAVDGSGNVFVTGSSVGNGGEYDYATIAYSGAGVALWTNRYSGPFNGGYDEARAVAADASGNVFVTGTSSGSGGNEGYVTIAYSGAGVPLWTNRYNGPVNMTDQANAVAVDGNGNVFVTGSSVGSGFSFDSVTIAYSGAGVPLWTNRYNGPANGSDGAAAVAVDASGKVFVTGYSGGSQSYYDYATIAYSGAGVPLWTNRYNGPANGYDQATAVAVDASGNVFVTGYSGGGQYDCATIGYSAAGVPLWTNYHGGGAAISVDSSGNVFVTGKSVGSEGDSDFATIAYSGAGVALWTNRYAGQQYAWEIASAVAVDASGNVFVTGSSTVKYSDAGVPLWTNGASGIAIGLDGSGNIFVMGSSATIAYSGAGAPLWTNYHGGGAAIAVDSSGNVFVTGGDATIKYSGAGVPLWTNSGGAAIAVDGSGNVVVTGENYGTIKYSGAGVPLWTNLYSATAVAVDGSGNVILTGTSWNDDFDYYTAKYAAADGSLLWEQRYSGPANGYDYASAVAVDASGNVFVTGRSGGPDHNMIEGDYYTAKYAAADGTLLWEKYYNGPANLADSATALAVDASGNVVVTGYVDSPPIVFGHIGGDYYTAKYAAADGATLWEKRFNRTWAGGPSPCLALGPTGMIIVSGTSSGDYATVVLRDVPAVSMGLISTGVRLRANGLPGRSYNIERAPAVTGPWSTINTQTAPASGLFEYLDTNSPPAAAFYRTSEP